MSKIEFIKRTIKHIRLVQDNIIYLIEQNLSFSFDKIELLRRGLNHDASKFSEELLQDYILTNEYFKNKRLGLDTSHIDIEKLKETWSKHQKIEKHHPHFKDSMDMLDLYEMCCDLAAMSIEFKEKDYTKYFKEKLLKDVPMLKNYEKIIIETLLLLQNRKL
jgi:hypothetical protein